MKAINTVWAIAPLAVLLLVAVMIMSGCATVTTPSGFTLKYPAVPFLDTTGAVSYRHEWLGADDNALHEEQLLINADLDSENQFRAFQAGAAAGAAIQGAGL